MREKKKMDEISKALGVNFAEPNNHYALFKNILNCIAYRTIECILVQSSHQAHTLTHTHAHTHTNNSS